MSRQGTDEAGLPHVSDLAVFISFISLESIHLVKLHIYVCPCPPLFCLPFGQVQSDFLSYLLLLHGSRSEAATSSCWYQISVHTCSSKYLNIHLISPWSLFLLSTSQVTSQLLLSFVLTFLLWPSSGCLKGGSIMHNSTALTAESQLIFSDFPVSYSFFEGVVCQANSLLNFCSSIAIKDF